MAENEGEQHSGYETIWPPVELGEDAERERRDLLREVYTSGVMVFAAHRAALAESIEERGGPVGYGRSTGHRDGSMNSMMLANGDVLRLSDLLRLPTIEADTSWATVDPSGDHQITTKKVSMSFGGLITGIPGSMNSHSPADSLDFSYLKVQANPFELFFYDSYFPEDVGITESAEVRHQGGKSDFELKYAALGPIWRPIYSRDEPHPDPDEDPLGYRNWSLQGDIKFIDLQLVGPVVSGGRGHPLRMYSALLMDRDEHILGTESEVKAALDRFGQLMGEYGTRSFPEYFSGSGSRDSVIDARLDLPELPPGSTQ